MANSIPQNIVLYADDDVDDIDFFVEMFDKYTDNTGVRTFRNGNEILEFVKKNKSILDHVCLIVLDINMPSMNGLDCLEKLREIPEVKQKPVILFTTSNSERDKSYAKSFNAGFITKPLDMKQMQRIVTEFNNHCGGSLKLKSNGALR